MKQTFEIPEGCNRVTIEQQGRKIITTFEPEFKDGDITCTKNGIHIFKNIDVFDHHYYCALYDGEVFYNKLFNTFEAIKSLRHATEEEKQKLFNAMAKDGKRWNAESKKVEDIEPNRWRAEKGCNYFYINPCGLIVSCLDYYFPDENKKYHLGNYFKTEKHAQEAAEKIKELLKQINP